MAVLTPRRLLRLYPGLFRLRYGTEFVALLEQTPITRAVVIDTLRAAAWEWLRWTRIGRVMLALVIAAPLAAIEWALHERWPLPLAWLVDGEPKSWSWFWTSAFFFCTPFLMGTGLLLVSRPPNQRGRRVGFSTQLVVLSVAALANEWLLALPVRGAPTTVQFLSQHWLGGAFFIALFLVWLFNVEGGAKARYPNRLRISGLDDDR